MSPETTAPLSGVDATAIREAARLLWQHRPVAHFTWTGLEQQSNATQTDRAIASAQTALRLKPDLAPAYVHLGNALRQKGELSKAARPLRETFNHPALDLFRTPSITGLDSAW